MWILFGAYVCSMWFLCGFYLGSVWFRFVFYVLFDLVSAWTLRGLLGRSMLGSMYVLFGFILVFDFGFGLGCIHVLFGFDVGLMWVRFVFFFWFYAFSSWVEFGFYVCLCLGSVWGLFGIYAGFIWVLLVFDIGFHFEIVWFLFGFYLVSSLVCDGIEFGF